MSFEFGLKLAGIFLGVLARSLVPWLRKLREGEVTGFSRRYFISMVASLALSFIATLVLFPDFNTAAAAAGSHNAFEFHFRLFCLAFGFGFGFNALFLEGSQWVRPSHGQGTRSACCGKTDGAPDSNFPRDQG